MQAIRDLAAGEPPRSDVPLTGAFSGLRSVYAGSCHLIYLMDHDADSIVLLTLQTSVKLAIVSSRPTGLPLTFPRPKRRTPRTFRMRWPAYPNEAYDEGVELQLHGLDDPVGRNWLFHYTSLSSLQKILESDALLMSRSELVNDPYEALAWPGATKGIKGLVFPIAGWTELAWSRSKAMVLSLSRTSGAPGFALANMWHHYGGQGLATPCCLVISRLELDNSAQQHLRRPAMFELLREVSENHWTWRAWYGQGPVHYESFGGMMKTVDLIQRVATGATIHEALFRIGSQVFMTKGDNWSNEQEYRYCLAPYDEIALDYFTTHDRGYLLPLENALCGVIVRSEEAYRRLLDAVELPPGVSVGILDWVAGVPRLEEPGA